MNANLFLSSWDLFVPNGSLFTHPDDVRRSSTQDSLIMVDAERSLSFLAPGQYSDWLSIAKQNCWMEREEEWIFFYNAFSPCHFRFYWNAAIADLNLFVYLCLQVKRVFFHCIFLQNIWNGLKVCRYISWPSSWLSSPLRKFSCGLDHFYTWGNLSVLQIWK